MEITLALIALAAIALAAVAVVNSRNSQSRLGQQVESLQRTNSALAASEAALRSQVDSLNAAATDGARREAESQDKIAKLNTMLADERVRSAQLDEKVRQITEEQGRLMERSQLVFRDVASRVIADQSKAVKEQHDSHLGEVLRPMKEQIDTLRKQIDEYRTSQVEYASSMKQQIKDLNEMNANLGREAHELAVALRGNSKQQGDWGEVVLQQLLEASGLQEGVNFMVQATEVDGQPVLSDSGTRYRPDVLLMLPDKKNLVIDAKTSLTAYVNYVNAETEDERETAIKQHVASVRHHIDELAQKEYQKRVKNSADFVMMFVPNEAAYLLAMSGDRDLWRHAYDHQVVIVSPTHLIAVLKLISQLWTRERQTKNAIKIAEETSKLYEKMAAFVDDMNCIKKNLDLSAASWDKAMKKLSTGRGNVIGRFEAIRKLGVTTSKNLPTTDEDDDPEPGSDA